MEKAQEIVEVLNDLIQINNDRIVGYQKAVKELKSEDHDLRTLFDQLIIESQQIKSDLTREVSVLHGHAETDGTTASGKIYRGWMAVRAIFSGESRHAVLANCERGEDAAQKAYRDALETEKLPAFLRDMLTSQQETLKESHDEIRDLRNQYA